MKRKDENTFSLRPAHVLNYVIVRSDDKLIYISKRHHSQQQQLFRLLVLEHISTAPSAGKISDTFRLFRRLILAL